MGFTKDLKLQEYINSQIPKCVTDEQDYDKRTDFLNHIYCNIFETIVQQLNIDGLSLEDMVKIVGSKAKRHNNYEDITLGYCIENALKTFEQKLKNGKSYNNS